MYNADLHMFCSGLLSTHDGRLVAYGLPEPRFIQRRTEIRGLLERLRHEDREAKCREHEAQRARRFGYTGESGVSRG
jgi:hypothetical protein